METNTLKILAIDDTQDNLATLKAVMAEASPKTVVLTALNGPAGIALALAEDPDVILLDIIMPEMDGFEVCRLLKKDKRVQHIPIIFLTAQRTDRKSRINALKAGAEAFLLKPLDEQELIAQVRAMAKIKTANVTHRDQNQQIARLIDKQTLELKQNYLATLNLLEDLNQENEARKKNEEALRKSELRFKQVSEDAHEWIWEFDSAGVYTYASPVIESLLGYKPEELVGTKHFYDLFAPDSKDGLMKAALESICKKERIKNCVNPSMHKDGHIVILESNSCPMIDTEGKLVGYRGVDSDITERLSAEQAGKRAEEELRMQSAALNAAANAILISDTKGIIRWVNQAFTTLTGYQGEEAVGKNPRELVKSGRHNESFYKQLWDTILVGKIWRGEMINRRKDGTYYNEEQTITPVRDQHGMINYFIAIKQDVTARNILEAQVQEMHKMESVGTLAGGIAHDFNNILAIILAYATLIEPAATEFKNVRMAIEAITKAVRRGTALVRQILMFARKSEFEFVAVDLNRLIEEVIEMATETFPRVITFAKDLRTPLPPVLADHTKVHQVLLNLCVNARDAMPDGGVLTISTNLSSGTAVSKRFVNADASEYILIEVNDTGIGMTVETQQRIFEPFYTTKESGKGTGLGLAMVFGIVRSHHGFIAVESELGKGTTFSTYLPLPSRLAKPAAMIDDDSGSVCGGTETILVVEDEALLMAVMRSTLMDKGYHVITAADGLQAVHLFAKYRDEIALVLTDIGLPQMGGFEEIAHIRQLSPEVRIIVTTGYLDPALESEMRNAGVAQFLCKPLVPSQILRTVREVLDAPGVRKAIP